MPKGDIEMKPAKAELRVGTSGWHYAHWRGVFYPIQLPTREWLGFYASHFDTVEINNSFYRLPALETFAVWRDAVPEGFLFAVKANRFITHVKRLRDPREALTNFFRNMDGLREKTGPILFQLPPRWKADPERLRGFIRALPPGYRYVFEFRDPSWFAPEIYRILEDGGCALCSASSPSFPEARVETADFAFFRFHGGKVLYGSKYSTEELAEWADYARRLLKEGMDVYAYFNNDAFGYAVEDALAFRTLVQA
ncbi:DUF72 domain-containing protein [Candidatus Solincola sp.]|nr:DUF72 domain-containing protein [Actinomycetota bacterium]